MRSISSCCLCTKGHQFKQGAWFHRGNASVNKKNIVLIQCNLVLSFISFAYFDEKWRHSPETVVSRLWNYVRIHLSTLTKISVLQQRALLTGNVEGYFWGGGYCFLATYLRSLSFVWLNMWTLRWMKAFTGIQANTLSKF